MKNNDDDMIDIMCGVLFLRLLIKRHKSIDAATEHFCDPKDRHFYLQKVKGYMTEFAKGE